MSQKSIPSLTKLAKQPKHNLVVSELLESIMSVWGGPQRFATSVFTEFRESKSGGIVRARMLSDIFRLFVTHTANLKGSATSVEGMSDEELKDAITNLLGSGEPGRPPE